MRWFLNVPPLMYRIGLAGPAGKRFLLLTTTGRKTGRRHTCGLNYIQEGDLVYVIAGWGKRSDWYRNLIKRPQVTVHIGRERWDGIAVPVDDPTERHRLVTQYSARLSEQGPPHLIRGLLRLLGFDYDAEVRESVSRAAEMPMVAIRRTP